MASPSSVSRRSGRMTAGLPCEGVVSLQFEKRVGLALIKQLADPRCLTAVVTLPVQQIRTPVELQENPAK
ncbi:MAG: hypothetical protein HC834_02160 [Rhodospirillales bacterium]|nr:hypothetical protein [Rhodospirillales bacterium]